MKQFIILLTVVLLFAVPLMADRANIAQLNTTDRDRNGDQHPYVTGVRVHLNYPLITEGGSFNSEDISVMLNATIGDWHFNNWIQGTNPNVLIDTFVVANENSFYIIFNEDYWNSNTGVTAIVEYGPELAAPSNDYIYTTDPNYPQLVSFVLSSGDNVLPKLTVNEITSDNPSKHYLTVGDELFFNLAFSEPLDTTPIIDINTGGDDIYNNVVVTNPSGYIYEARVTMHANDTESRDRIDFTIYYQDVASNFGELYTDEIAFEDGIWFIFDKTPPSISMVELDSVYINNNLVKADPTNLNVVNFLVTWEEDYVLNFTEDDITLNVTGELGDELLPEEYDFAIDPVIDRYGENVLNQIQLSMTDFDFDGTVSFTIQDVAGIADSAGNVTADPIVIAEGVDYDYIIDNTNPNPCDAPTYQDIGLDNVTILAAATTDDWYPEAGFYYNFKDVYGDIVSGYQSLNDVEFYADGLSVNTQYSFYTEPMDYSGNQTLGYGIPGGGSVNSVSSFYTLVPPPVDFVVDNPTIGSLSLHWNLNGAPNYTEYSIMSNGLYVQGPGLGLVTEETWLTANEWNAAMGREADLDVDLAVTGLEPGTEYTFDLTARNGDNVETSTISDNYYTIPEIPVLSSLTHTIESEYYKNHEITVDADQNEGGFSYYRYIFNQIDDPGTFDITGSTKILDGISSIEETLLTDGSNDGTWYMHVMSFVDIENDDIVVNDEHSEGFDTFQINFDITAPTDLNIVFNEVAYNFISVSGLAVFDVAGHNLTPYNYTDDNGVTETGWLGFNDIYTFTALDENTQYTYKLKARDAALGDDSPFIPSFNTTDWEAEVSKYTLLQNDPSNLTIVATEDGYEVSVDPISNPVLGSSGYKWLVDGDIRYDWGEEDNEITITGLDHNQLHTIGIRERNGDAVETNIVEASKYTLAENPAVPVLSNAQATTFDITYDNGSNITAPQILVKVKELSSGVIKYIDPTLTLVDSAETCWFVPDNTTFTLSGLVSNTNYEVSLRFRNGDNVITEFSGTESIWTTLYNPVVTLPNNDNTNWYRYNSPTINITQSEGTPASSYTIYVTQDDTTMVTIDTVETYGFYLDEVYGWDAGSMQTFELLNNEIDEDGVWYIYAIGWNGADDPVKSGSYGVEIYNYDVSGPVFGIEPFTLTPVYDELSDIHTIIMSNLTADFSYAGANLMPWNFDQADTLADTWTDQTSMIFENSFAENESYSFRVSARDNALGNLSDIEDFNLTTSDFYSKYTLAEPPLVSEIIFDNITTSSFDVSVAEFNNAELLIAGSYCFQLYQDGDLIEDSSWITENSYSFNDLTEYEEYSVKVAYRNVEEVQTVFVEKTVWTIPQQVGLTNVTLGDATSLNVIFQSAASTRTQIDADFSIKVEYNEETKWVSTTSPNILVDVPMWQNYTGWFTESAIPISVTELFPSTEYKFTPVVRDHDLVETEGIPDSLYTLPADIESLMSITHNEDSWYRSASESNSVQITANQPELTPNFHYYKYYVSNILEETIENIDTDGIQIDPAVDSFYVSITGDDIWYIHVLAYNPEDEHCENKISYRIKLDETIPVDVSYLVDIDSTEISLNNANAVFDIAGAHEFPFEFTVAGVSSGRTALTTWGLSGLSKNTNYVYQVNAYDSTNVGSGDNLGSNYTLCPLPTGLAYIPDSLAYNRIFVTVDAFPNHTLGSSAYHFILKDADDNDLVNEYTYGINSFDFTDLEPNSEYSIHVSYLNGDGVETTEISINAWTQMAVAGAPDLSNPTISSIDVTFNAIDISRAQVDGDYAVVVSYTDPIAGSMTSYVQADFTLGTEFYQTFADWNNGVITISDLAAYTNYSVLIRTRDNSIAGSGTHDTEVASIWTLPLAIETILTSHNDVDNHWFSSMDVSIDYLMPTGHPNVEGYKFIVDQNTTSIADSVFLHGFDNIELPAYDYSFVSAGQSGEWYVHAVAYNQNTEDRSFSEVTTQMIRFDHLVPGYSSVVLDTTATTATVTIIDASDAHSGLAEFGYNYYAVESGETIPVAESGWVNSNTFEITGLNPNSEYNIYFILKDLALHNPNIGDFGPFQVNTKSLIPVPPVLIDTGAAWIDLQWLLDANLPGTDFALYEVTTGMYLNNNFELNSGEPVWFTMNEDNYEVGVIGLSPETEYEFVLVSRNIFGDVSDMSDPLIVSTIAPVVNNMNISLMQNGEILTPGDEELTVGELFDISLTAMEIDKYGQIITAYNFDEMFVNIITNYPNNLILNSEMMLFIDGLSGINNVYVNAEFPELTTDLMIYVQTDGITRTIFQYGPIAVYPAAIAEPVSPAVADNPNDQGGWINLSYGLSANDPFADNPLAPYVDYYVLERSPQETTNWEAVAFILPYNPLSDSANVLIEVPASDEVFEYQLAAVYNAEPYGRSGSRMPEVVYPDEMIITRDAYYSNYVDAGSTNAADNIGGYAQFTVYLEGAYNSSIGLMNASVELPLVSPYDGETIEALPVVEGYELVDWIEIELRATETGSTIKNCNAFLLEDGSIVDINGENDLPFYYTTGNDYYIVINHRNHIGIMTADSYQFADIEAESTVINLADDHLSVYGAGIKVLNGICAMYAGDMYKEEFDFIGSNDSNVYLTNYNSVGYNVADVNLDGFVGNADINFWLSNYSKAGTIPFARTAGNDLNTQVDVASSENISIHYGITNNEMVEYPNGDVYYEFDIIANSSHLTKFLTGQIFLGYNTDIFGTLISNDGNLIVNAMDLVDNMISIPGPAPDVYAYSTVSGDFAKGVLSAGSVWNSTAVDYMDFENASLIDNVSQNYLHIAMKCSNIPVDDEILVWFVDNNLLISQQSYIDKDNSWVSYDELYYDAVQFCTPEESLQNLNQSKIAGLYPNPFNPTTTLYYELASEQAVSLYIYNIKGQLVKTVNEGVQNSGNHSITWNGDDNSGKSCSSGVYFFKLNTGSNIEMTRALMLK